MIDPTMNQVTEPLIKPHVGPPAVAILAQFDDESIIVYQAYRPAIGHFVAKHGFFGSPFSLN